jgi:hypothetical protein
VLVAHRAIEALLGGVIARRGEVHGPQLLLGVLPERW